MTEKLTDLVFGRSSLTSGVIAMSLIAMIALGCTCGKDFDLANIAKNANVSSTSGDDSGDTAEMPDDRLLRALVKETTADFALAVSTDDFSQLYAKASEDFKATFTEQKLKETFRPFVEKKKQVLPILAKSVAIDPEYSPDPYVRTEKGLSILVAEGKFDTKPAQLTFEYEYVMRGGEWKLLTLKIRLI
jgi:hypothetical protein